MGQHGEPIDQQQFGRYLRAIREQRRLSLDAVEEMSAGYPERITKSHLSRIENGQAVPTFPRMFALSQIYGVPVASLAERFEVHLIQGMTPQDLATRPVDELRDQGRRLRIAGRYREALQIYNVIADTLSPKPGEAEGDPDQRVTVALDRISCLVHLNRNLAAREECEAILNSGSTVSQELRARAMYFFAVASLQMGHLVTACMVVDEANRLVERFDASPKLRASIASVEGYSKYALGDYERAAAAFQTALARFEEIQLAFEVCRARLNLAAALVGLDQHDTARTQLKQALEQAKDKGYDRQRAQALNALGSIAFKEGKVDAAESHCLQSNQLARARDFYDVIFANCYYLWKIAEQRRDEAGVRLNERTLRAYVSRVDPFMPEVEAYRRCLAGGEP